MELFARVFGGLRLLVYHCFDRLVIHGYLSGLRRPEQVVYFFREVVGAPAITQEVLSRRTNDYQGWVEAYALQPRHPDRRGRVGGAKERLSSAALAPPAEPEPAGRLFHSEEHGAGFHLPILRAQYPTADPQ